MSSKFKISIPKPCHENWNTMTPKEKGRFCNSCTKTVVDFTKKSTEEIQDYLIENKSQRVCGHFYKKQLDTIVIEIPQVTFQQQLSFQKLFILALFFVMGTTLFSCQYTGGKKQKIEDVIIQDSIKIIEEDVGLIVPIKNHLDSINSSIKKDNNINSTNTKEEIVEIIDTIGELEIEGDINYEETEDNEIVFGMIIQEPPRFKEAKNLSKIEAKKDFDERIQNFTQKNFDVKLTKNLGLSEGKYRISTQFKIDKTGNIIDIKVRAPHPKIKKEVIKMLKKLPQLIPGKQAGKIVKTTYYLPISFIVE